jgi:hypothetical protein
VQTNCRDRDCKLVELSSSEVVRGLGLMVARGNDDDRERMEGSGQRMEEAIDEDGASSGMPFQEIDVPVRIHACFCWSEEEPGTKT